MPEEGIEDDGFKLPAFLLGDNLIAVTGDMFAQGDAIEFFPFWSEFVPVRLSLNQPLPFLCV